MADFLIVILFLWMVIGFTITVVSQDGIYNFYDQISSRLKKGLFLFIVGLLGGPAVFVFMVGGFLIFLFFEYIVFPGWEFLDNKIFTPVGKWFLS